MRRNKQALSLRDLQSKPAALCLIFLLVYYARKLDRTRRTRPRSKGARGRNGVGVSRDDECPGGSASELLIPHNGRLVHQHVCYVPAARLDHDYANFARPRKNPMREMSAVLGVVIPSLRTRVVKHLVLHMAMLGLRTYMSLLVADLDGRIVRHLIGANGPAFVAGLCEWLALAVPASYTNAMIKYLEGRISLEFRVALVRYIHDLYMHAGKEYYKLNSIDGALEGVDHYITSDVTKFCSAAAKLYSNLGKPSLDLFIFAVQLSSNLGRRTMIALFVNYFATAMLLRTFSPNFGRLAARETQLEGEYRNAHSRVITNAEEIAFYDGAGIEKESLGRSYRALANHIAGVMKLKAFYSVLEGYILKYSWSASGYLFASVPVFFPSAVAHSSSAKPPSMDPAAAATVADTRETRERENMGRYVTNKRLMLSISDAGGRIMYSIKDMAELAGYTHRVYQLIAALHRVRRNAYYRRHEPANQIVLSERYTLADVHGKLELIRGTSTSSSGTINTTTAYSNHHKNAAAPDELVSFQDVPVVVPGSGVDLTNGEKLLDPLTFDVHPGQHLLIVGSNGTGKSSISRLAAGLWPVYRGLLRRSKNVSFLPQRPYFSTGTLRDQIIYPQCHEDMLARGITDNDLLALLKRVNLAYLPEREGGLDVENEWKDVFSGGEKQRMLFARLLYAKPKFAFIDEGTSAVSADMEGQLYEECKSQGITLITISHRLSLLKYHDAKLEVGLGSEGMQWSYESSAHEKGWQSMDKEIEEIRDFLKTVPDLKKRRDEVARLLQK